jgi:hypothetical protein
MAVKGLIAHKERMGTTWEEVFIDMLAIRGYKAQGITQRQ